MSLFKLISDFKATGDQPAAIKTISTNIKAGREHQVLLGVTGSGKTFTMAQVISEVEKPALIIAPNKTLAGQLYNEFKNLFPENAVEYFVSYYDYYQPEAYLPSTDTYIQKDSAINEMIDKLRHSATRSVLSRRDVIVVASVSCIYGLGAPEDYLGMRFDLEVDTEITRTQILKKLVSMQYDRNDTDFFRGVFRVRGDRVEVFPAYEEDRALRIDFFGDKIEEIVEFDPINGKILKQLEQMTLFPASHYATPKHTINRSIKVIQAELKQQIEYFRQNHKLIEAQRIEERTNYDLEMMLEMNYCTGIENYSRYLTGRRSGQPPPTLLDYFPDDFLVCIDESHISVSQIGAMYKGDRSRKETLVQYGFRLPSAMDNRPLKFEEFSDKVHQVIYVSATPADYELTISSGAVAEQIVRPTGLVDPVIEVRDARHQVDDLMEELQKQIQSSERSLVTTLTKNMAEDLTDYYIDLGLRVRYLHADIKTLERLEIIQELRQGDFDTLVGINLLREGLDIPEVSLVAILDADKEGFLRSARSLIQICGRAARNINGRVIMYAEKITKAMQATIDETERRRAIQLAYNQSHHIKPATIQKLIQPIFNFNQSSKQTTTDSIAEKIATKNMADMIIFLKKEMQSAARHLEFEKAAQLRDQLKELKEFQTMVL